MRTRMTLGLTTQTRITERLKQLDRERFGQRLAGRDSSLWKTQEAGHQRVIRDRLGWLGVSRLMQGEVESLSRFADEVRREGFTHALLLGMGGSSLFPEVCRMTFGVRPGYLDVDVLDSTNPTSILTAREKHDLSKTLLIVSSKSGTTTETLSLFAYFSEQGPKEAGARCVAITDPGTPLERLAKEQSFRRIFLNPPDIGGRYSALSFFGLVPAALLGVDISALLGQAEHLRGACEAGTRAEDDPGVWLGAVLAELGQEGRDKVTFSLSSGLAGFGYWLEQLLAESTGKEGKGLIPVEGEPLGEPGVYGNDRVFVSVGLAGSADEATREKLARLEEEGHPVVRFRLEGPLGLGAECYRWERASAVIGSLWGINPFDEPNVKESKDNTHTLLEGLKKMGRVPPDQPLLAEEGFLALYGDRQFVRPSSTLADALADFLSTAEEGNYVALMAYLERSPEHHALLQQIRISLRDSLQVATTLGYGPRFLHSTGQLHKGGPNTGLFLQLTADTPHDVAIPKARYTFARLHEAQARGDLRALKNKGRGVIRIHLKRDVEAALKELAQVVAESISLRGTRG